MGDRRDFKKYVLLRKLRVAIGAPLGVCWMRSATRVHDYLLDTTGSLAQLDQHVTSALQALTANVTPPAPSLDDIERSGVLGSPREVMFFSEDKHGNGARYGGQPKDRESYLESAWRWFDSAPVKPGIVFFDPDTGVAAPLFGLGRSSYRHLSLDTLDSARASVCAHFHPAIVVYQHKVQGETLREHRQNVDRCRQAVGPGFCFFSGDVGFVVLASQATLGSLVSAAKNLEAGRPPDGSLNDAELI